MVNFVCPHCKNQLEIPDEHLGKTGRCNHCGAEITIQPPPGKPTTSEPKRLLARATLSQVLFGAVAGVLVFFGLAMPFAAIDTRHDGIRYFEELEEVKVRIDAVFSDEWDDMDDRDAYIEDQVAFWKDTKGLESTFSIVNVTKTEERTGSLSRLLGSFTIDMAILMSGLTIFARLVVLSIFPDVTGRVLYICCFFSHIFILMGVMFVSFEMFPTSEDFPPTIIPFLSITLPLQIIPTAIVAFYHHEY